MFHKALHHHYLPRTVLMAVPGIHRWLSFWLFMWWSHSLFASKQCCRFHLIPNHVHVSIGHCLSIRNKQVFWWGIRVRLATFKQISTRQLDRITKGRLVVQTLQNDIRMQDNILIKFRKLIALSFSLDSSVIRTFNCNRFEFLHRVETKRYFKNNVQPTILLE